MSRSSLSEQAYAELRSAIITGRFAPAATMVLTELAAMLGVSRTPVREALLRLELEGFLERQSGGRLVVHWHTPEEVEQLFLVRELLEGHAARLAATRISDAELEQLEAMLVADRDALKHHRIDQLAALNDEIHGLILEASRNRTLRDLVASLRARIHGLGAFAVGRGGDQHEFVQDHTTMARLLRESDADAIEELAKTHVRRARDLLVEGLRSGDIAIAAGGERS